ncbi:MAG: hypothetical protein ABIP49_10705, partial [Lysobacterales bacterium]
ELVYAPNDRFDVALAARSSSRFFADDLNSSAASGFAVFDLSARRRWNLGTVRFEGFARIDNLLDREYVGSVIINEANGRYFEPSPGRTWLLGLDATLAFD